MSTLKTHNLQSPDAGSVNIAMTPNAGMVVAGISTFNNDVKIPDNKKVKFGNDGDLEIYHNGNHSFIDDSGTGNLQIRTNGTKVTLQGGTNPMLNALKDAQVELYFNNSKKLETTNTGAIVTGILTATSFKGDGSQLSNLPASAPVGGSASNKVFFENDKVVSVNYQITSTKNAMTAGPVSVNAGIAVTVPSGCSWTIV